MAYKSTETTVAADVPTQLADFLEQQRTERKQPKIDLATGKMYKYEPSDLFCSLVFMLS